MPSAVSITLVVMLAGCADDAPSDVRPTPDVNPRYHAKILIPREKPAALTGVRVEQHKHPQVDGQRMLLYFGSVTVYVCAIDTANKQRQSTTSCSYPAKRVLRKATSKDGWTTIYAVDRVPVEGKATGTTAERSQIGDLISTVTLGPSPPWLREALAQRDGR